MLGSCFSYGTGKKKKVSQHHGVYFKDQRALRKPEGEMENMQDGGPQGLELGTCDVGELSRICVFFLPKGGKKGPSGRRPIRGHIYS